MAVAVAPADSFAFLFVFFGKKKLALTSFDLQFSVSMCSIYGKNHSASSLVHVGNCGF